MNNPLYKVTHFYRRSPSEQGWIQTAFVTRKQGESNYYLGLTGKILPNEKIRADMENGSLQVIPSQQPIYDDQAVWIAPDQSVYVASVINPRTNPNHKIFKDQLESLPNSIESVIEIYAALVNLNFEEEKAKMESILNGGDWKSLITIMIVLIKRGDITPLKFASIGYLFYKAQSKYPDEFAKVLNKYDAAIMKGRLNFIDIRGNQHYWDIGIDADSSLSIYFENFEEEFTPPVF